MAIRGSGSNAARYQRAWTPADDASQFRRRTPRSRRALPPRAAGDRTPDDGAVSFRTKAPGERGGCPETRACHLREELEAGQAPADQRQHPRGWPRGVGGREGSRWRVCTGLVRYEAEEIRQHRHAAQAPIPEQAVTSALRLISGTLPIFLEGGLITSLLKTIYEGLVGGCYKDSTLSGQRLISRYH
jgi:hypothetical protein